MTITADDLLEEIKLRITLPASQVLLSNPNMLKMADRIISSKIVPLFTSVNHDYFVYMEEEEIEPSKSIYSIPYRSVGRALRELKIRDDNNNVRNVPLLALEDSQYYINNAYVAGFYFQSDKIRLVPDVPANIPQQKYLQKWYELPPNKLIQSSEACLVLGIGTPGVTTTEVTVAAIPTTIISGAEIDFIQGRSGNSIYNMDVVIQGINGTVITFLNADVPDDLTVGDYISPAGYSPVLNFIPNEAYSYVETRVSMRILQAIGDFEGLKVLKDEIKEEKDDIRLIIAPRIVGEPTLIVNRTGLVRGNKVGQRNWLYGSQ